MQQVLVFLYGPPAAGKFTIAQELSKRTGIPLFHNHAVVDIASGLFEFGSEDFVLLREDLWLRVFKQCAVAGKSLIFTFNPEQTVRPSLIDEIVDLFKQQGARTLFINLTCSNATCRKRLNEPSRQAFGKLKDSALFDQLQQAGAFRFDYAFQPATIINTDTVTPKEACQLIIRTLAPYR